MAIGYAGSHVATGSIRRASGLLAEQQLPLGCAERVTCKATASTRLRRAGHLQSNSFHSAAPSGLLAKQQLPLGCAERVTCKATASTRLRRAGYLQSNSFHSAAPSGLLTKQSFHSAAPSG